MDRREFACNAIAIGGAVLSPRQVKWRQQATLRVDGRRVNGHLRELAEFGKNAQGGISRVAYSEADLAGREYVMGLMRAAQLDPSIDAAGNIIGRRAGRDPTLPPLMLGSHIDSVPEGGNYDGQVGSMAAIEVAHTLADHALVTRHPLEVAIFQNEEGGKTGSRALSGEVEPAEFDLVTRSGLTIGEGIGAIGGDRSRFASVRRRPGSIAAYLELHIEQGAILDKGDIDIGVVEGIVGIKRWRVTVEGFANHAGTTPMDDRQDALLAASRFVDAVNRVVTEMPGRQVGTVGQLTAEPGAPNVVPGRVTLSVEIRDLEMDKIDAVYRGVEAEGHRIGEQTGTTFDFEQFYTSYAAPTDERIRRLVAEAAGELALTSLRMPSGAGHDAQSIALLAPVGMIFIPSVDGISHSPREFSHPEDVENGANVLLRTLLKLDAVDLSFPLP
ncbi:MAG: Zn-dependent hydrolase [Gemmatimonadetes bacterium]|nr:Zn-dependent hydrolase [Gemmatimonadota bacterium]